jgi:hypothetical protein
MVLLSVAVLTRSGRALIARQFVEMPRLRVEGLLGAFPKLVATESAGTPKQHTYVETDSVRYVYLPLESSLYLLLVTNKGSNIVEDLDTLRLLSRVIPEQLGLGVALTEDAVSAKAFELLFAIDEVVASGGYREEVTLHQVRGGERECRARPPPPSPPSSRIPPPSGPVSTPSHTLFPPPPPLPPFPRCA